MATNRYFSNYTHGRSQDLLDDLITEAIKIHGIDLKYLPRTIFNEDVLLGEDPLSRFTTAVDIEFWVKSNTSFEGDREYLSKFNLELRDRLVLVMARNRWNQIKTEKLLDEVGYNYQHEDADTTAYANSVSVLLESGTANGYSITTPRPMEGDLLYFEPNGALFEVKFVDHEAPFYPHGKGYTYELTCEQFRYSSEQIRTGNTALDAVETSLSLDLRLVEYLLEDGGQLLEEDGGRLVQEARVETAAVLANNEFFTSNVRAFTDFSETNPFSGY